MCVRDSERDQLPHDQRGFKVPFGSNYILKCSHREGSRRCESWAIWRISPQVSAHWGEAVTRYYCNSHVPDLPIWEASHVE
jgi:hypothetical protein